MAGRDDLGEGGAAIVGEEVRVYGGVVVADAAAIRGREVGDRGLVPGAVESFAVEADLDLGAAGQGRGRRGLAPALAGPATAADHWGGLREVGLGCQCVGWAKKRRGLAAGSDGWLLCGLNSSRPDQAYRTGPNLAGFSVAHWTSGGGPMAMGEDVAHKACIY